MEPKKIKNPTGMLIMHGTVIAVVLYMAWQLVRSYRAGGAEAPSLTTLIVGLVLLVGGCVVVGWLAVRLFLQAKREEKALEQETEQLHAILDMAHFGVRAAVVPGNVRSDLAHRQKGVSQHSRPDRAGKMDPCKQLSAQSGAHTDV